MAPLKIGIIAPSSKIPRVELNLGVERIRKEGFQVQVHPQCYESHLFFAGEDATRARAFFEFAHQSNLQVLWCARGGHGAIRLLPLLKAMTQKKGKPPRKLLIGYSDSTALMEFVRKEWGWSILHGPMPSLRKFSILDKKDWDALSGWIRSEEVQPPWSRHVLRFWANPIRSSLEGPLVGGNLTVWNCLLGTSFEARARGCLLFLEDVEEPVYRIDRMLRQLALSESFAGVKGILLGNFLNCKDSAPWVLKKKPSPGDTAALLSPDSSLLKRLRPPMKEQVALKKIFYELGRDLRIPVAAGLPVGHGPEVSPLPLAALYRLSPQGILQLIQWDWLH